MSAPFDDPVPASAHPGVEAAHDTGFAEPHRPWWTHAHPAASFEEQLSAAVAAQAPFFPDVSEHNGPANWDQLEAAWRAGLVLAVAMRAGFGTVRADKQFARNQAEARRRGIPNIPYWFCYSAYNSPAAEAQMFDAVVGPLRPGEAMAGDFEDDPNAKPFLRGAAGLRWCQDFLGALQSPPNATWAYSYPALVNLIGLQALAATWPFWIAAWGSAADSTFTWPALRQFTNCGSTPGVSGCCDQSRVLRGPLSRWLTPGSAPAPAADLPSPPTFTGRAMSNIQIPDPKSEAGLFDVVLEEGTCRLWWGFHGGGEGEEEGATDWVNPVPDAPDGPVLMVPGTVCGFARVIGGVTRLTISGRRKSDDKAWEIVLRGEPPWGMVDDWSPRQLNVVIAGGVPGPKGDPGKIDDDHIAAVAAAAAIAEIERRLENG